MTTQDALVLVTGAGPAGTAAAIMLARHGIDVVLASGAGDPEPYDALISAAARASLAELGVEVGALAKPVPVIDLKLGSAPTRQIVHVEAASCDRGLLRGALLGTAITSGARLASSREKVNARHLVVATGALPGAAGEAAGIACARRFTGPRLEASMMLAMSPPPVSRPGQPPVSAWALPGSDGVITVGAARVGGPPADPEGLLAAALCLLAAADPAFETAVPAGPLVSGPLNAGFSPDLVADARQILVGDAAGLATPFTGEGLSAALRSGIIAARAITAHLDDPEAARRRYARLAAGRFAGYFETARHATHRYHLTWRILSDAAESDHPFFAKIRRAIVAPGMVSGPAGDLTDPDDLPALPFLASCDETALRTIRRDWPFLAHILLGGNSLTQQRLRPARLFLAGLTSDGGRADIRHAVPAAATELAALGALAFLGPSRPAAALRRGVDWVTTTTVVIGDFLLAAAARLIAESAPAISWSFADWLGELAAARATRLDGQGTGGDVFAVLLEFPARFGATLGGARRETTAAMREAGFYCGHAFAYAEDILLLRGERSRLDTTLSTAIEGRFSSVRSGMPDPETAATVACRQARDRALAAASLVPDATAARLLRRFIAAVAAPAEELAASPERVSGSAGPSLS